MSSEKMIRQLASPAGRMPSTRGHCYAEELILGWMRDLGLEAYKGVDYVIADTQHQPSPINIVGVLPGMDREAPPVLIGAHYDSVIAAPCADDNAAAVVIAFEAVRKLKAGVKPPRDVVLAIFDMEEPPNFMTDSMGSEMFVTKQMDSRGVSVALIMDLVGHDPGVPSGDCVFALGAESSKDLPETCRASETQSLNVLYALSEYVGDMSDHGAFRRHGFPFLFLTSGIWEHYHQASDTPDKLNRGFIDKMVVYMERLVRVSCDKLMTPPPYYDHTLDLEVEALYRLLRGDISGVASSELGRGWVSKKITELKSRLSI